MRNTHQGVVQSASLALALILTVATAFAQSTHILVAPDKVVIAQLGLEKNQGLVIDSVKPDSAGAKLGFQPADIWVKVDGKPVTSSVSALRKMLNELKPDATVEVVVLRKGKPETVKGFAVPAPVRKE